MTKQATADVPTTTVEETPAEVKLTFAKKHVRIAAYTAAAVTGVALVAYKVKKLREGEPLIAVETVESLES